MNITEAIVKTAFITSSDLRANIITLLVSGELDICDNCGFTMKPANRVRSVRERMGRPDGRKRRRTFLRTA